MKRTFTVAVLYSLLLTAAIPSVAQDRKSLSKSEADPIADVKQLPTRDRSGIASVQALSEGVGVLVRWVTTNEKDRLGFYIYRQDGQEEIRVNTSMIPTRSSGQSASFSGEEYRFFDPDGRVDSVYRIVTRSTTGARAISKQFTASYIADLSAVAGFSSEQLRAAAVSENKNLAADKLELTDELLEVVESSVAPADPIANQWVVAQPGARIGVKRDGMHRIMRSQLPAGVFDNTNTANWRLFTNGNEQAINVGPGGQYIDFYGKGIDTAESDIRVYYLLVDTQAGKRIGSKFIRPFAGGVTARSYPVKTEFRERTTYLNQIQNGPAENYWGRFLDFVPDPDNLISFNLTGVDTSVPAATVTIKLQGSSSGIHQAKPSINGNALTPFSWSAGETAVTQSIDIPTTYLREGANSLEVLTGGAIDLSYFDSVTIAYSRKYVAAQNRLSFTTPGSRKVNVEGFSSPNVRVFDVSADGTPVQISNATVVQNGSTFTAGVPAGRAAVLYAVEDSGLLSPEVVSANVPSTLMSPGNGADALIISHSSADMLAAAENWATYRRSAAGGGFNVKVIDVSDIYDEFNYGVTSAASLRAFLGYAYESWQKQPQYVLLLGDSTVDPRNYEGLGPANQVPTHFIEFWFGDSASDEALADFDNDGLAEMSIGRIAARTGADVTTVLNKTISFETPANLTLDRGVLFAYDQPLGWDFAATSQLLRGELAQSVPTEFIQRMPDGSTQPTLMTSVSSGKYLVNYAGHGSSGGWGAASSFLAMSHVPNITNAQKPSVFLMLTCLNGYFVRTDFDSLSESLTKSGAGGGVAVWASTTETTPDLQETMGRRFFDQIDAGTITRLGDLIRDAKGVVPGGDDVRFSWALIGDPMLKMR